MRRKYIFLCIILILLFGNCSTMFCHVKTVHDEFDGFTKNVLVNNYLGNNKGFFEIFAPVVSLGIQRFQKNNYICYDLVIKYEWKDWLFIEDGESLILLIDNQRCGFSGEGSSGFRDVVSSLVVEYAYYETTPAMLKKIANAKEIKVKLKGSRYYCKRLFFTERNFQSFKKFIAEFVEGG